MASGYISREHADILNFIMEEAKKNDGIVPAQQVLDYANVHANRFILPTLSRVIKEDPFLSQHLEFDKGINAWRVKRHLQVVKEYRKKVCVSTLVEYCLTAVICLDAAYLVQLIT